MRWYQGRATRLIHYLGSAVYELRKCSSGLAKTGQQRRFLGKSKFEQMTGVFDVPIVVFGVGTKLVFSVHTVEMKVAHAKLCGISDAAGV